LAHQRKFAMLGTCSRAYHINNFHKIYAVFEHLQLSTNQILRFKSICLSITFHYSIFPLQFLQFHFCGITVKSIHAFQKRVKEKKKKLTISFHVPFTGIWIKTSGWFSSRHFCWL